MRRIKKAVSVFIMLTMTCLSASGCSVGSVANKISDIPKDVPGEGIREVRRMTTERAAHTATLLNNGKVLMAGGFAGGENSLRSAELFDPTTSTFVPAGNMSTARAGHTATLLSNGKVLISGGYNGNYLNSVELYDPRTGRFTTAGRMVTARSGQVAVLLKSGKVLLAGGVGSGWSFLADAEIYDPDTNSFAATSSMTVPRESHTATLLKDGRVLITGGHNNRRPNITIFDSCEIYNPASGAFRATGNLIVRRHKHDAVLLSDGRVLIVGGSDERDGRDESAYSTAEIFNPEKGTFTGIDGKMNSPRYKLQGTAILLQNGKVLIAGGADRAEVFDPADNTFSFVDGTMGSIRLFATATLLNGGQVLISGGYNNDDTVSSNAWIYKA